MMQPQQVQAAETRPALLFVDDEQNILKSLRRVFRAENYEILTAESGEEGLKLLENQPVELVISDMRMPHMDGAAFLQRVAEKWPGTIRILLTGFSDLDSTISAINRGQIYRYLSKPWDDQDLLLTVRNALKLAFAEKERERLTILTESQNKQLKSLNAQLDAKVKERTAQLESAMHDLRKTHETLKNNYSATVKVFSNMIETREGRLAGHSRRVAALARGLAQQLGLKEDTVQTIVFAGLLHDIGKISLPDALINKPYSTLSEEDKKIVQQHAVIGEHLLIALEPLHEATVLIRHHHERFDGGGYPDRKAGAQIPLGARILAVVNDYDAMQQGMLGPNASSPEHAKQFLIQNKGTRYDPAVVEVFVYLLGENGKKERPQASVQLSTKGLQSGMVLNKDLLTKDGVLLLAEGHTLTEKLIEKLRAFEAQIHQQFLLSIRR